MDTVHYIDQETNKNETRLEILKTQVQNLSSDDIITYIGQLEQQWRLDQRGDPWVPLTNGFKHFYQENELDESGLPREIDVERLTEQNKRKQRVLGELYHRSVAIGIFDDETEDINGNTFKISTRINRLIDMADDAYETVFRYSRQYDRINNPTYTPVEKDADHTLFRCTTMDLEELSSFQQLILALLNDTYVNNIRRYKGNCCKQIVTIDGYPTKAWKAINTIKEYVHGVAQKETRFEVWKNLTTKGSAARDAINHLSECRDMQFPEIQKNRHVWSFNNGIFIGKEWCPEKGAYTCNFYNYESDKYACLDPTIVSCKFFDLPFKEYAEIENWWDIPTPHFDSIMEYQLFEEEVCRWMFVMGGRLCFDIGEIDHWQIIPFLKGIARSGKSTIITKVFKKFYENDDCRTLSNNIERKFGLASIYDGFMFIAPEVKGDLCLEQAEFQSMVSGEDVSVAVKHEKARSIEWKSPGILGGNEIPNWKDNSGSVLRRILPWNFSKQVMTADPHLDDKLDHELPAILLKCVRGYLDYAQKYSDQDIWNVVPGYFKTIQTQVAMITNSLRNFLASEKVKFGEELFCPQKIFVQIFNQHCQENNLGKFKFNPDFYAGPFSAKNLEVRVEARTYKGRAYPPQPLIFGVDVIEDTMQFADD